MSFPSEDDDYFEYEEKHGAFPHHIVNPVIHKPYDRYNPTPEDIENLRTEMTIGSPEECPCVHGANFDEDFDIRCWNALVKSPSPDMVNVLYKHHFHPKLGLYMFLVESHFINMRFRDKGKEQIMRKVRVPNSPK